MHVSLFIGFLCFTFGDCKEYTPYNGWYNNRANPANGAVDTVLTRHLSQHYEDGVYAPSGKNRPNPRDISNEILSGTPGLPSFNKKTALFYYFGEHVMQEIVDAEQPGCPPEYFNIPVPTGDPQFDPNNSSTIQMPYQRTQYDTSDTGYSPNHPRDQLNQVTSFLDGSAIYGTEKLWTNQLRYFQTNCPNRPTTHIYIDQFGRNDCRGELSSYNDEGKFPIFNTQGLPLRNPAPPTSDTPLPTERFYKVGGRSVNENPFILSIGVLWFRYHNWLAKQLSQQNPSWSEERVFNEARIRNIATYQHIVMDEWLPALLENCSSVYSGICEDIPAYTGYKPATPVGVSEVFQAAAKYYLLTLAPPGVFTRGQYDNNSNTCQFQDNSNFNVTRVCNTYWEPQRIFESFSLSELIMGMSSQTVELEDHVITEDLRNYYYGPLQFSRRDLAALVIQQGRDHGLPDYDSAREELGLQRKGDWQNINPTLLGNNSALLTKLMTLYNNDINNLDIFVGGLLETSNGQPGELFRYILRDQFVRLRNGDRFWFENTRNGLFNSTEISEIKAVTFRDVILRTNPSLNESVDIQDFPFFWNASGDFTLLCPQPFQINGDSHNWTTTCVPLHTYDYFASSEISYAIVFALIGLFILLTLLYMYLLGIRRQKEITRFQKAAAVKRSRSIRQSGLNVAITTELLGTNKTQQIQVVLGPGKKISTKTGQGNRVLRNILNEDSDKVEIITSNNGYCLIIRTETSTHDLVLKFPDSDAMEEFFSNLKSFLASQNVVHDITQLASEDILMHNAKTKEKRDKVLQKFFKCALKQAVKMEDEPDYKWESKASQMINTTISKEEFAEYLKIKVNSLFVEQMFAIADADDDGKVSFREFLNIVVLFTKGSPQDKIKLMFDMYDTDKSGELSLKEFTVMLKSMMEMVNASIDAEQLDQLVKDMMESRNLGSKESLTLDDFQSLMGKYSADLSQASLVLPGNIQPTNSSEVNSSDAGKSDGTPVPTKFERRKSMTQLKRAQTVLGRHVSRAKDSAVPMKRRHTRRITSAPTVQQKQQSTNKYKQMLVIFVKWNQYYSSHIFILSIYTLITVGVFLQAFNAVTSNQPSGLAIIGGRWMAIARASAAGLMFNFSTLLLTMCRNTITLLRETFFHRFIPFDSSISMHKCIAWMALFFTALHVIAHGINFYSISTQSPADLLCLFRDYWYPSNYLPNFVFWAFQTITGVTGVILTLIVIVMYVFASNFSRRRIFNWFQWTHKLGYFSLYFFSVLHGSGALISSPRFYLYFLGPATLFALDKLYSLSRKKVQISVVKAELLPSDVTHLEFKRPANFNYHAGQWVRIACLAQSPNEYHPFTLSSAPHEDTLKLHIRAVGPWTMNLRNIYNPETLRDSPYPKLYLDGPFGEGHQDWYKYDVSVLVGGGIGVTPFASILKDLVNTTNSGTVVACKSVYFIWVTRDQKQYEWLTDIIKEVEENDTKGVLNTHIFITQFPQKFDLRTTMLYICEQHFQKIAGKSLFTGLAAVTHFGRPDFVRFLASLAEEHNKVANFGVFSCGPPPMTNSVDKACSKLNKYQGPTYSHHFENF